MVSRAFHATSVRKKWPENRVGSSGQRRKGLISPSGRAFPLPEFAPPVECKSAGFQKFNIICQVSSPVRCRRRRITAHIHDKRAERGAVGRRVKFTEIPCAHHHWNIVEGDRPGRERLSAVEDTAAVELAVVLVAPQLGQYPEPSSGAGMPPLVKQDISPGTLFPPKLPAIIASIRPAKVCELFPSMVREIEHIARRGRCCGLSVIYPAALRRVRKPPLVVVSERAFTGWVPIIKLANGWS